MARTWKEIRAAALAKGLIDEESIARHRRRMRNEVRAHRLKEIRETFGLSQTTVAERLNISQSRVSHIERGEIDRTEIATVRCYIEALGGEMEIIAKFGDERITVN